MGPIPKPHVVCLPLPLQGHINPMLRFAKLLHYRGFHVTFVNTEFNHKRMFGSTHDPDTVDGFCFRSIPLDHQPPSTGNGDLALNLDALIKTCRQHLLTPFRDLIDKLNSQAPPVTCILSDAILGHTVMVSQELGIPHVLLWAVSASGYLYIMESYAKMRNSIALLKDGSGDIAEHLDIFRKFIPGLKGAQPEDVMKYLQSLNATETNENELENALVPSAIVFDIFEAMDQEALRFISSTFPKVFSIGPLNLLLNTIPKEPYNLIGCNLWNVECDCTKWLDSKQLNSVIYVNFGSMTVMAPERVVELAWGLAKSDCNFLWIIRPGFVKGEKAILPQEFVDETKERAFLGSWCEQEKVLNHQSVAGFITHSGWNSTIESISSGVPMICWPFCTEHLDNCRKSCNELGVGVELSDNFTREEVENVVREVLSGEKAKKLKIKALEWKKKAEAATSNAGTSLDNLDILVNEVLL
ncbi:hypothetical protein K2173_009880 [Erythroxylum novogranatense]|uniref:Glycosyltransferase n=1 Tax=Erythroxylum novogranatense TaxID=1862640 RepID=A0AAV8T0W1_9ROSI|nr:hypothetical protein K2173_009880 [Erythroxylum novogranatense]